MMRAPASLTHSCLTIMKTTSIGLVTSIAALLCALGTVPASAIDPQPHPGAGAESVPEQSVQCGPASARLCSESALFRQLPELKTSPDTGDTESQPAEPSLYRELQILPKPMIVPEPLPNGDDILLERRPGDLG